MPVLQSLVAAFALVCSLVNFRNNKTHEYCCPPNPLHWSLLGHTVHGSLSDGSYWHDQLAPFAEAGFRATTYSRRYNFPNTNKAREAPVQSRRLTVNVAFFVVPL
jgi:hypothetical protein